MTRAKDDVSGEIWMSGWGFKVSITCKPLHRVSGNEFIVLGNKWRPGDVAYFPVEICRLSTP
jgi:hypothetical protein